MRLQEGEKVLHELRPSGRLLGYWALGAILPAGAVCIAGFAIGMPIFREASGSSAGGAMGALLCAALTGSFVFLLVVGYLALLRKTYVYTITNQRCVFRGGILWRRERSVPYHKVTDVEQSQIIFERLFGIGRVKIYTPGTGQMQAEIVLVGLEDTETPAAAINEILRQYRATGE